MVPFTRLLFLFLALTALLETACAQAVLQIDSLPADGVVLKSGWRWHPGDNPAWASRAFDDSQWDTIQPSNNITKLPKFQQVPMGWLRLTLVLDSAIAEQVLSAEIQQIGASELYVDGTLLYRLGRVGGNYQSQIGYTPTPWERYMLPRLAAGRHVLAIRLSQHRYPWYVPKRFYRTEPIFFLKLASTKEIISGIVNQIYGSVVVNSLLAGLFLMLSAIHFLYYWYRRQRINLIFGLTALFTSGSIGLLSTISTVTSPEVAEWLSFVGSLTVALFMIFLLATYYVYLSYRLSWLFWLVTAGLIVAYLLQHLTEYYRLSGRLYNIAVIVLFIDGLRVGILAVRAGRPNARLILGSSLLLLLIIGLSGIASFWLSSAYPEYVQYIGTVTNLLFFITIPISFAIILAREYAQTNRNLEKQLAEIQQLSTEKETILKEQNETLERQVAERTTELTQSLADLRETQQQLIQREKMASLGELTAGIAHEIQNPLNFVNNFAEISTELVAELKEEQQKESQRDEELEIELLGDLEQNLSKISQHGNRASAIVRSMLDHTRTSTGQREPVDLNALIDEFLRLAYHGLRAKDKDGSAGRFNAQLVTHFDPTVGSVTVVPQDLGRVLLNLFNNAFYAVQERSAQAGNEYQPTVTAQTRRLADVVEISVTDNGTGVPPAIRDKIFQPFFTTKPTGQGTGLGLSLSYDIITKGHGGKLTVETEESKGTTFRIQLPVH